MFQRTVRLRAALALSVLLIALTADEASQVSADGRSPARETILVKFTTAASENAIAGLNASQATTQVDAIPALGLRVLRVPPGKAADTVAAVYARSSLVKFAEVNALVAPGVLPNDPKYGSQWHLPKIQTASAWDTAKATGIRIGVCDTGFEATHPDLQSVLRADLGWNAADGSTNWAPITNHGTIVAGAAAAATNNGTGVAGVAWGAQIVPVRISNFSDGSAYISDAVKCIQYAADNGARAINVSYLMAGSASIDSAGEYARGKGALTFVAAGNGGVDPGWPNYPNFLAISATNSTDATTSWSNYGDFVDFAAPGDTIWTTTTGGKYGTASGTSLSSPVAAGVAALVFGANPALTAAQAETILRSTAMDLAASGTDPAYGSGRVDAKLAVQAVAGGTPSPGDTTAPTSSVTDPASTTTVSGTVSVTANASDDVGVTKVEFYLDGILKGSDTSAPYAYSWDTTAYTNASHSLTARAYDAAGNVGSSASVSVTVQNSTPDTTPPSVTITSPAAQITVSGTANVAADASDNVGVAKVEFFVDGVLMAIDAASPYSFSWDTTTAGNGDHSLTAKAYDAAGNAGTSAGTGVTVNNVSSLLFTETFSGSVGGKNKTAVHNVTVSVQGSLSATLTWGGNGSLTLAVYDSLGNLMASGLTVAPKTQTVTFVASPGEYRLAVTALSGRVSYTLTATHY